MSDFPLRLRSPGLLEAAASWLEAGVLGPEALQIVDVVAARFGEARPEALLALALVLEAQHRGHTALDLRRAHEALTVREDARAGEEPPPPHWPTGAALERWEAEASIGPLVGDQAEADRPFARLRGEEGGVLLMSRRMAAEQRRLASAIARLVAATPQPAVGPDRVAEAAARLFDEEPEGAGAHAMALAAGGSLTVVTGGPGTGKTWSIKRLLALLLEQHPELRIVLAAPTGKAAVRMTEAMGEELEALQTTPEVKEALKALPASTVHKLLRIRPDSGATRYGPGAALPADVVVVDEASMLDVTLIRKLAEAMGAGTRLLLLGDKDQLASVESGTVLADLVAGYFAGRRGGLSGRIAAFTHNHRFKDAPTVAAAARAVQAATAPSLSEAMEYLMGRKQAPDDPLPERVRRLPPQPVRGRPAPALLDVLTEPYLREGDRADGAESAPGDSPPDDAGAPPARSEKLPGYAHLLATLVRQAGSSGLWPEASNLLRALDRYRVLATHRRGPLGVSGLNRELGRRIRATLEEAWGAHGGSNERSVASSEAGEGPSRAALPTRGGLWLGEPVLVTTNAYDVDLRNGDIGLVLPVPGRGLQVVFPVSVAGERSVRAVPISRLPAHTCALAMTVHKSQGSQFDEVALVLAGRPSPIQTRELIYTGLTRARTRVSWVGTEEEMKEALGRPVGRISALGGFLAREAETSP